MKHDYEYALHYVLWGKWDELFTLMLRTEDDLLRKKIQHFLYAYYYSAKQAEMIQMHDALLHYVDYALGTVPHEQQTIKV